MEITTDLSGAAAATGARLLDLVDPGWAERIDLDTLNLRHPDRCILGQLFSGPDWPANCAELERRVDDLDPERRRTALGIESASGRWAINLESQPVLLDPIAAGFDVFDSVDPDYFINFWALNQAWRVEIVARTHQEES